MVAIEYNGNNKIIEKTVARMNQLFCYHAFTDAICAKKIFDMANVTAERIAQLIHETELRISLDLYWPLGFSGMAYAYDDINDPNKIHMNKLALNRPIHSLCNTMMHQAVHAINAAYPEYYFGHGDNRHDGKCDTAPFWIAGLAQKMVAEDNNVFEQMPHEAVQNIPLIESKSNRQLQEELYEEGIFCVYDYMAILEA